MGERPDERALMWGGWQGEGVSAGDEGRLLYSQPGGGAGTGSRQTQTLSLKDKLLLLQLLLQSHCDVQVVALMYHFIHISPTNVPLHPGAKDYFLLIFRFSATLASFVQPICDDI